MVSGTINALQKKWFLTPFLSKSETNIFWPFFDHFLNILEIPRDHW
jgi:hypothetical protein